MEGDCSGDRYSNVWKWPYFSIIEQLRLAALSSSSWLEQKYLNQSSTQNLQLIVPGFHILPAREVRHKMVPR